MQHRSRRPSPAMVVALIALFVALGGGAYAGVTLANNSVLSKHIKNGEVKKSDLAANAVTGAKIADGEVRGADVGDGSLADADIAGIAAGKVSGKVASAASADTATNATNATSAANADKLDNLDSTAFQGKPLWAHVAANGTILSQSGGITVLARAPNSGRYHLNFGVPVTGKLILVGKSGHAAAFNGGVEAVACGGSADAITCSDGNTNTHVFVSTTGADNLTAADQSFFLAVFP